MKSICALVEILPFAIRVHRLANAALSSTFPSPSPMIAVSPSRTTSVLIPTVFGSKVFKALSPKDSIQEITARVLEAVWDEQGRKVASPETPSKFAGKLILASTPKIRSKTTAGCEDLTFCT